MKYKIVTSEGMREEHIENFEYDIQSRVSSGWSLSGSPFSIGGAMCQAVTLDDKVYEMGVQSTVTEAHGTRMTITGYNVVLSRDLYNAMMELAKRFYFFYVGAEFEDMHELGDVPQISNLEILFSYLAKIEDRAVFRSLMYSVAKVGGPMSKFFVGGLRSITPDGHTEAEVLFTAMHNLGEEKQQQFVLDALGIEDAEPFSFSAYFAPEKERAEMQAIKAKVKACL